MSSKHISAEQIAIMVDFMERHGDIANMLNTPQARVRRQELWQSLKVLLGQVGSGPDKTVEQWVKTWCDLKHRTKRKSLLNRTTRSRTGGRPCRLSDLEKRVSCILGVRNVPGGSSQETNVEPPVVEPPAEEHPLVEPSAPTPISEQIADNDEQNNIDAASSSTVCPASPLAIDAASDSSPSQDASQSRRRRNLRSKRRISSNDTPFERVRKEFAAAESQRLKLEEARDMRQHEINRRQQEIDLKRLELDILRETNYHARAAERAQIDRDTIKIQHELLEFLKVAIDKFCDK